MDSIDDNSASTEPTTSIEEDGNMEDYENTISEQHMSMENFENLSFDDHEADCITRKALSRDYPIGSLYDIRTDRFTGNNIFSSLIAESNSTDAIRTKLPLLSTPIETEAPISKFIAGNLLREKLEALNIEPELEMNIRSGTIDTERGFLKQTLDVFRPIKFSFVYEVGRKIEQLNTLFDEEVFPHINRDQISAAETATHVVIGVKRGTSVQMTISAKLCSVEDEQTIQDYLKSLISLEGLLEANQLDLDTNMHSKLYSNTLPYRDRLSNVDFIQTLQTFHRLKYGEIQSDEPLSYILWPLSNLHNDMQVLRLDLRTWKEVPEATIQLIGDTFNELETKEQDLAKFYARYKMHQLYIPLEIFDRLQEGFSEFQTDSQDIKARLGDVVHNYRNGLSDEGPFSDLVGDCVKLQEKIGDFMQQDLWKKVDYKVEQIQGLVQLGVRYVEKMTSNETRRSIVFYCSWSSRHNDPSFKETMDTFKNLASSMKIMLYFIDQDKYGGPYLGENRLCYYKNGKCLQKNLLREIKLERMLNIAMPMDGNHIACVIPDEAITLRLSCPLNRCKDDEKFWLCSKCRGLLSYDFDSFFYCTCGKLPTKKFKFRCGDETHGDHFITFEKRQLDAGLSKLKRRRLLNLLILGETGAGKSTFINGFANYLSFPSLKHARRCKPICLVPAHFTHFAIVGKQYKEIPIRVGPGEYEAGKSCKAKTQGLIFEMVNSDFNIRLIDTPGIGDTDGPKADQRNFENILRFIENIEHIHGILILLPSNYSRVTEQFKYCIGELLTKLHKSAVNNIIFCLTNVSSSAFAPGDSLSTLRTFLEEDVEAKRGIHISTDVDKIYLFENEALRYLCCLQQGIELENVNGKYDDSWKHTAREAVKLIDHASRLKPHQVRDSKAVNDIRRIIITLAKPLAYISVNIQTNMLNIEDQQEVIGKLTGDELNLKELLMLPHISIESHELTYPTTMCAAPGCVETRKIPNSNNFQTIYATQCHIHCYLDAKMTGIVPNPEIKSCVAIDDATGNCLNCGCKWDVHMYMRTHQEEVLTFVENPAVREQLDSYKNQKAAIQAAIESHKQEIEKFKREEDVITKTCGIFAKYLDVHCLLPYSDAYGNYVRHLIEIERTLVNNPQKDEKIKKLEKMLEKYEAHKRLIDTSVEGRGEVDLSNDAINQAIQKLFSLELKGAEIKSFYDKEFSAQQKIHKQLETKIRSPELQLPENEDEVFELLKGNGADALMYDRNSLAETAKKVYQSLSEWSMDRLELLKEE